MAPVTGQRPLRSSDSRRGPRPLARREAEAPWAVGPAPSHASAVRAGDAREAVCSRDSGKRRRVALSITAYFIRVCRKHRVRPRMGR